MDSRSGRWARGRYNFLHDTVKGGSRPRLWLLGDGIRTSAPEVRAAAIGLPGDGLDFYRHWRERFLSWSVVKAVQPLIITVAVTKDSGTFLETKLGTEQYPAISSLLTSCSAYVPMWSR